MHSTAVALWYAERKTKVRTWTLGRVVCWYAFTVSTLAWASKNATTAYFQPRVLSTGKRLRSPVLHANPVVNTQQRGM